MTMILKILNSNPQIVLRNLKIYNILNKSNISLEDLNIIIDYDSVFCYYKYVGPDFILNDKIIEIAKESEEWFFNILDNSKIRTNLELTRWNHDNNDIILYNKQIEHITLMNENILNTFATVFKYKYRELSVFIARIFIIKYNLCFNHIHLDYL